MQLSLLLPNYYYYYYWSAREWKRTKGPLASILFYSFNYTLNHRLRYLSYRANVRNTITDTSEEYQSNCAGRAVVCFFFFFPIDSFFLFFLFPFHRIKRAIKNQFIRYYTVVKCRLILQFDARWMLTIFLILFVIRERYKWYNLTSDLFMILFFSFFFLFIFIDKNESRIWHFEGRKEMFRS